MSDRDCRAELCPMWDGESCPCQAFGLDPDDPPAGGVFETVTPITEPLLPLPKDIGQVKRCSVCRDDLPDDEPTMTALANLEGFGHVIARLCAKCSGKLATPPPLPTTDTDPDEDLAAIEWEEPDDLFTFNQEDPS